jgi:hypothetical protein
LAGRRQAIARNQHAREGAEAVWAHALAMLDDAVARGVLPEG